MPIVSRRYGKLEYSSTWTEPPKKLLLSPLLLFVRGTVCDHNVVTDLWEASEPLVRIHFTVGGCVEGITGMKRVLHSRARRVTKRRGRVRLFA